MTLVEWSAANNTKVLLNEWNSEKNKDLLPSTISFSSAKKVWWKCNKGHEYQAAIDHRTKRNQGCPYCSNRKILKGYNDLLTTQPLIAAEWNYLKNGNMLPANVNSGSSKKVWWLCSNGHEYETTIQSRTIGAGCPYCSNRKVLRHFNDFKTLYPELAEEWNYEKNGLLMPYDITHRYTGKIWWKCSECGFEWETHIENRMQGRGCLKCGRFKALETRKKSIVHGRGSLALFAPELIQEWNYNKNGTLSPENVTKGSHQKVWWKCQKCGFEWCAQIKSRSNGCGCPECGKMQIGEKLQKVKLNNSLLSINPSSCEEWNYDKNGELSPDMINAGSSRKVWWKCIRGHEWQASISSRATASKGRNKPAGCPICSGKQVLYGFNDIETQSPILMTEWDFSKNVNTSPSTIYYLTQTKFWWLCHEGHSWRTSPYSRNKGTGCPVCSNNIIISGYNDLLTKKPLLASEWHPNKNSNMNVDEVAPSGKARVWWICKKGHEWQAPIYSRAQGIGCPICSKELRISFPEKAIYYYFKKYFADTIGNYKPNWLSPYEIDVFIPQLNLGIEYDGQAYHKSIERDIEKNNLCNSKGIALIRIREPKCPVLNKNYITYTLPHYFKSYKANELNCAIKFIFDYVNGTFNKNIDYDVDLDRDQTCVYDLISSEEKKNSLGEVNPELSKEWNYLKNGMLTPFTVSPNSNKYVWWICYRGHEWQSTIVNRNKGRACPICSNRIRIESVLRTRIKNSGSLQEDNPILSSEWHPTKNNGLSPNNFMPKSNKKVWWQCANCGFEWQTTISHRNGDGRGCPQCAKKNRKLKSTT